MALASLRSWGLQLNPGFSFSLIWWPLQSSMQELPGHGLASPAFLYHEEDSTSPLLTPASFLAEGDPCYWSCQGLLPAWDGACQCPYICVSSDSLMCLIPLLNKLPFALGGPSGLFTDCKFTGVGSPQRTPLSIPFLIRPFFKLVISVRMSTPTFYFLVFLISSNCTFCFVYIYGMKVRGPAWGQKRANRKG